MKNNNDKNWINKSIFTVSRKKYNKQKIIPEKNEQYEKTVVIWDNDNDIPQQCDF